jgi:predicted AAA+ superfamily ATPase
MPISFQRPFVATLAERFAADTPLIQVLARPRQVGKTTGVRQMLAQGAWPHHYANADDV